jgi:RimJ/RimL family protein N-acetyltransferase
MRAPRHTHPDASRDTALRHVTPQDLPVFYEQQRDPVAVRMAAFPARERDAFLAHWQHRILADASVLKRTILVDGQVAGHVLSWPQEDRRLIGYWLGREHWGRGVATAALSQFLRHELVRPLYAHVAAGNRASSRVLEKCGFHRVDGARIRGADGTDEHLFQLDG